MVRERRCIDCPTRFPQPTPGPWIDPFICPECGGDETVGIVDVDADLDELARLMGESS
jgi:hypothetical protein